MKTTISNDWAAHKSIGDPTQARKMSASLKAKPQAMWLVLWLAAMLSLPARVHGWIVDNGCRLSAYTYGLSGGNRDYKATTGLDDVSLVYSHWDKLLQIDDKFGRCVAQAQATAGGLVQPMVDVVAERSPNLPPVYGVSAHAEVLWSHKVNFNLPASIHREPITVKADYRYALSGLARGVVELYEAGIDQYGQADFVVMGKLLARRELTGESGENDATLTSTEKTYAEYVIVRLIGAAYPIDSDVSTSQAVLTQRSFLDPYVYVDPDDPMAPYCTLTTFRSGTDPIGNWPTLRCNPGSQKYFEDWNHRGAAADGWFYSDTTGGEIPLIYQPSTHVSSPLSQIHQESHAPGQYPVASMKHYSIDVAANRHMSVLVQGRDAMDLQGGQLYFGLAYGDGTNRSTAYYNEPLAVSQNVWITNTVFMNDTNKWQVTGTAPLATLLQQNTTFGLWVVGTTNQPVGTLDIDNFSLKGAGPPVITLQPVAQSVPCGYESALRVSVDGDGPMTYFWLRNGADYISQPFSTLVLTNPTVPVDQGSYQVIAANQWGAVTSQVVVVTVLDPYIMYGPGGVTFLADGSSDIHLAVTAVGTPPISYQWWKDGLEITDATTSYSRVSWTRRAWDSGNYYVVVSNMYGCVTSEVYQVTVLDPFTNAKEDIYASLGHPARLTSSVGYTSPFQYQWRKDGNNIPGANASSLFFPSVQMSDSGAYTYVVSNLYGCATSAVAQLSVNLAVPDYFNPALHLQYSPDLVIQPDGRILADAFRINADGSIDATFQPCDTSIRSLAVQTDGKILVGGSFTNLCGEPRNGFARFNPDGSLDESFDPSFEREMWQASVGCLALQPDGKMLVAGNFQKVSGQNQTNLCRLNTDGTLDTTFNIGGNLADEGVSIDCMVVQPDGKIVVGGRFELLGGQIHTNLARLNSDGTLDFSFIAGTDQSYSGRVKSLAIQPDGRILVSGVFNQLGGQSCTNIGRINADGSLDTTFHPTPYKSAVVTYGLRALQSDGMMIVDGDQVKLNRLYPDGTIDSGFLPYPNWNWDEGTVILQPDGKVLISGVGSVGHPDNAWGISPYYDLRNGMARLNNTIPAMEEITVQESSVTWLRGGSSPEISWAKLDYSTNQVDWVAVGLGNRVSGGWQFDGMPALPATTSYRVRGCVAGVGRSFWIAETIFSPPIINMAPLSSSVGVGQRVTLRVDATGGALPLSCQWRLNGTNIVGATAAMLNVYVSGNYDVVISNALGVVVSPPATVIVMDPFVQLQPVNQSVGLGQTATFSVSAGGTPPISFQWRKDGVELGGATLSSLVIPDVTATNLGGYEVVITNSVGSITSIVATLTLADPFIITQPTNQTISPGQSATFAIAAGGTEPFSYQWFKDGISIAGATSQSLVFTDAQATNAGGFKVAVMGPNGSITSAVAVLNVNLASVDAFNPGAIGDVYSLAVQPNGQILVGGYFNWLGGQIRANLGRVSRDGVIDASFNPGATGGDVWSFAVQTDGKILVGGRFTTLGGQTRNCLGRLTPDGALDTSFNSEADAGVYCLVAQPDGKVLVGGGFNTLSGAPCNYIGRLNTNGTLDPLFGASADYNVYALAVQSDGKIVVGGDFWELNGQDRSYLGRLNLDGTLDATFSPEFDGDAYVIAIQPDGKILVGGYFESVNYELIPYLVRLDVDGFPDPTFHPDVDGAVNSLALQADGKILVAGGSWTIDWTWRGFIKRLNADGSMDRTFALDCSDNQIEYIALQPDGNLVVGGQFSALAGQSRLGLGRINLGVAPTESLTPGNNSVIWLRGGAGPEVEWTTFEYATYWTIEPFTNWTTWQKLGTGTRISGGWQWIGPNLPSPAAIRARGFTSDSKSGSFVETLYAPPVITTQPTDKEAAAGQGTWLHVDAWGGPPLFYQWYHDDFALTNNARISGAQAKDLTVNNLLGSDTGSYSVVVSNSYGMVTSLVASVIVRDLAITSQPQDQTVNAGGAATLSVTASGTPPFSYQWRRYGTNIAGATSSALLQTNLGRAEAGLYDVVVANAGGSLTSTVAILTVNLSQPDGINPAPNYDVMALALQPDGKVLVGGYFTSLGGQARNLFGRLNSDGTLDAGTNFVGSCVKCLAVQEDGKILVGGNFSQVAGQFRTNIARFNVDGSLDTGFNPGVNRAVNCLALQADGKILVGGDVFTVVGGQARTNLARLNQDGTLDTSFDPRVQGTGIYALAVTPDDQILVGGYVTKAGGLALTNICRLNLDGTVDADFNPGANGLVNAIALQTDGKILLGGSYSRLTGQVRNRIGRLNADGSLDASFNPDVDSYVYCLAVQTDGKILAIGSFWTVGGQTRRGLVRLNSDGTLDPLFAPQGDSNDYFYSMAMQADGAILVGGNFNNLGRPCTNLVRLLNPDSASHNLAFDGSTLVWQRGGSGPEVWQTIFDYSTNDTQWIALGSGTRISGGWQLTGVSLPFSATIRARGFVAGYGVSSWLVEDAVQTTFTTLAIVAQSTNQSVLVGQNITLNVTAQGSPPLTYQWRYYNTPISGATSSALALSSVQPADSGPYSVVVSNPGGSVTSSIITLTVFVPPEILSQPTNRFAGIGQSITFTVTAWGTEPLNYQWQFNTTNLPGATQRSYTLNSVQPGDAGNYRVVVTNFAGSVTSAVASLTIMPPPAMVAQPTNQSVLAGQPAAFSVTATGSAPLSYQWRFNGSDLPGASASSYSISSAHVTNAGPYVVVVTDPYGSVTSSVATLTILGPPVIITQPTNLTVVAGQTAIFNVGATGTEPLVYQWRFNGSDITGANANSYSIASAQNTNAGSYVVVLTNAYGSVTSAVATLTILLPPGIIEQPTNQTVIVGQPAAFSVTATGTEPLGYQWRFNGSDIAGATADSYSVISAQTANAGSYMVVVTNLAGSVTSAVATLNVLLPPDIATQPTNQMVIAGQSATFNVGATGTEPLSHQWLFNGNEILGATTNSYSVISAQATNAGSYAVVVTNAYGSVTSAVATLTVLIPPGIIAQPTNQTVIAGQPATVTVTASGTDPLCYQWRFNGSSIPGATNSAFSLQPSALSDSGSYTVVVTNLAGSVTSAVAALTVLGPPTIVSQPVNQTVTAGQAATFSVTATGHEPLNYQWRFNGVSIPGANTNSYVIAAVQPTNAGSYAVVVANVAGSITSAVATLRVSSSLVAGAYAWTNFVGRPASPGTADGTGNSAYFNYPGGVGTDELGNVYIADRENHTVRKATALGEVTTLAGSPGVHGYADGTGSAARFHATAGVVADAAGSLLVADLWNGRVRKVTPEGASWTVTTIAASTPAFCALPGLALDSAGNLYASDYCGHNIRKLTLEGTNWVVRILAGLQGVSGNSNGTNSDARFQYPYGVALDSAGNLYVADYFNHAIRKLSSEGTNWVVTTLAGLPGTSGCADGTGSSARFSYPSGIAVDNADNVLVGDSGNNSIRRVTPAGVVTTIGGVCGSSGTSDGIGSAARFNYPMGLAIDSVGVVYVADYNNHRISRGTPLYPPTITVQPVGQSVPDGTDVSFSVTADGAAPLGYQWYLNGSPVSGATAGSLTVAANGTNAGDYRVVVNNYLGSVTSVVATLTVLQPPAITAQPTNQIVVAGQPATFSVTATGTEPLCYQWRLNAADLSGATNSVFSLPSSASSNAGPYTVVVTNVAGSVTSAIAMLTVIAPPAITSQPTNQTVLVGQPATFSVAATGTEPLSHQWRFNGADLPGATNSAFSLPASSLFNAGSYTVIITNVAGSVTSAVATLTVTVASGVIAQWNFNSPVPDANTATGTNVPSIGLGTALLVGGVNAPGTGAFEAGSTSDPAPSDNSGWSTVHYPALTASNKTAGIRFDVSTAGYRDIAIRWDQRCGGNASKYFRLQYTANGTDFLDAPSPATFTVPNMFQSNSVSLAAVPLVSDNASFAFKVVAEFEATAIGTVNSNYVATGGGSYAGGGIVRFDLVTVSGTPIATLPPAVLQAAFTSNTLRLTWPAALTGYLLEQNTDLRTTNWTPVTSGITEDGTNKLFLLNPPATSPAMFYRLHAP